MPHELARADALEIRIGNVSLPAKLDALGAALAAIREAHRGDMPPKAWAALYRAQDAISEAMLCSSDFPRLGGGNNAPDQKAGYLPHQKPAGVVVDSAGNGAEVLLDHRCTTCGAVHAGCCGLCRRGRPTCSKP